VPHPKDNSSDKGIQRLAIIEAEFILEPLDTTMIESLLQDIPRTLSALEVQGIANEFLSDCLPDRFTADQPVWVESRWRVPVILAYPIVGSIGEVGELWIDGIQAQVLSHTPLEAMKKIGMELYKARQDDIEAAFS
jgi:hypothetical protein